MKIALCSTGELYGGVEVWLKTFCDEIIVSHGDIEVTVILFCDSAIARALRDSGICVVVLPVRRAFSIRRITDIYGILKTILPDIVHIHGAKANMFYAVPAKLLGIRLVKTVHGESEPSWFLSITWFKRILLRTIEIMLQPLYEGIIAVTNEIKESLKNDPRRQHVEVIYNAIPRVNIEKDNARELYDKDRFNIGIVGRLTAVKGHYYLLNAMRELKKDIPTLQLHVIGSGSLKAKLEGFCRRHHLFDHVTFHGFQEKILLFQAGLDLLIMPSLQEGLPYVLLYGMAFRVPIIASDVGGLKEVLRDKDTAFLVPPRDSAQLSAVIQHVYEHWLEREEVAERAYREYEKLFSIEHMVNKYRQFYSTILGDRA